MRTARKAQQAMFLENLWREMDKLSSPGNKSISKMASKYASEGYESGEIVELLVSDGFDPYMSQSCVSKMGSADDGETSETDEPDWGFEAEDQQRGDIANNFDVGCDGIKAATESEAWEKAQAFLDTNCNDQYTIIKVHQL